LARLLARLETMRHPSSPETDEFSFLKRQPLRAHEQVVMRRAVTFDAVGLDRGNFATSSRANDPNCTVPKLAQKLLPVIAEGRAVGNAEAKAKKAKAAAAKDRKAKRDAEKGLEPEPLTEDVIEIIRRRDEQNDKAEQRLTVGFVHTDAEDGEVCGERVADFSEKFEGTDSNGEVVEVLLRSRLGCPVLGLLPAMFPKACNLKVGRDKTWVRTMHRKVLALDQPMATFGGNGMLTMIVKELDSDWKSPEALRRALLKVFPAENMPSGCSGRFRNGVLKRPHLFWILEVPVWNNPEREIVDKNGVTRKCGDKRCRLAPIKLYNRVSRGLTKLLLPLKADPSCTNIYKMKNPLSPHMSVVVLNGDNLHSLQALKSTKGMDLDVRSSDLMTQAVVLNGGQPPTISNDIWIAIQNEIHLALKLADKSLPAEYLIASADKSEFEVWIDAKIRPTIEAEHGSLKKVDRAIKSAAKWHASRHKPRQPPKVLRGRYKHLDPITLAPEVALGLAETRMRREANETARKAAAGKETAARRKSQTVHSMARGMLAYRQMGFRYEFTKAEVVKYLVDEGFALRSTSYALWDEALFLVKTMSRPLPSCKKVSSILPSLATSFPLIALIRSPASGIRVIGCPSILTREVRGQPIYSNFLPIDGLHAAAWRKPLRTYPSSVMVCTFRRLSRQVCPQLLRQRVRISGYSSRLEILSRFVIPSTL
jgi:hypothetical protein